MKKTMMMFVMSASLLGFGSAAFAATDYNRSTDAELSALCGKMSNASVEERMAYRNECQKRFGAPGPDARRSSMGGPRGRWQNCGPNGMHERLGLNDKQSAQVQELRKKHFNVMMTEREKLVALNRELRDESIKTHPDNKKIDGLSEKIGKLHETLARMKSTHLAELASILSPAQLEKMQTRMDCRPMRGNCGMMP